MITVYSPKRPEVKYTINESIEDLKSRKLLSKYKGVIYYDKNFIVSDDIDNVTMLPGNLYKHRDVGMLVLNDQTVINTVDYTLFNFDNDSQEILYNNIPVKTIDNSDIHMKDKTHKLNYLKTRYGIIAPEGNYNLQPIDRSGAIIVDYLKYGTIIREYYSEKDFEKNLIFLTCYDNIVYNSMIDAKILAINEKPVDMIEFVEKYGFEEVYSDV